jgi:hypothetical protein
VTSIIDLENLSYQRHYYWPGIAIFRELLSMFEANYPERTKRVIVVRAPKAFPVAYNLIKPFMDEVTRNKIIVLGSTYRDCKLCDISENVCRCRVCVCVHIWVICLLFLFQVIGKKSFRSTSVQTSCHRLMVEPDVNQTLTAQIM